MTWTPNTSTQNAIWEFIRSLLGSLPTLLGIDEIIPSCELTNLDPFGVGTSVVPRQVQVRINRYLQAVWYNGSVGLTVGNTYTVMHTRIGDRYELAGPSGSSGGGGSYTPPSTTYAPIVVDCVSGEVVIDCVAGEVVSS